MEPRAVSSSRHYSASSQSLMRGLGLGLGARGGHRRRQELLWAMAATLRGSVRVWRQLAYSAQCGDPDL